MTGPVDDVPAPQADEPPADPAEVAGEVLRYEPNPKHREPWQRGRRGSLCTEVGVEQAQQLLNESVLVGEKRYAVYQGRPYCAQAHEGVWHGYPIGWVEVPAKLRTRW